MYDPTSAIHDTRNIQKTSVPARSYILGRVWMTTWLSAASQTKHLGHSLTGIGNWTPGAMSGQGKIPPYHPNTP
jgi:hypothetical protein